jgi:hypothetical protein
LSRDVHGLYINSREIRVSLERVLDLHFTTCMPYTHFCSEDGRFFKIFVEYLHAYMVLQHRRSQSELEMV